MVLPPFKDSIVGQVSWSSFVCWADQQDFMHDGFKLATGMERPPPPSLSPLDAAVDAACGLPQKRLDYSEAFIVWVTVMSYGWDLSPKQMRDYLEELIKKNYSIGPWRIRDAVEEYSKTQEG